MSDLLDDPSGWWLGHIGAALIKSKITDPLNAWAVGIIAALADSGYVTSGIFAGLTSSPTGCTVTAQKGRIEGNKAWVRCIYTLGTTAVASLGAVGTDGNVNNTPVLNIVDSRFVTASSFSGQGLASGSGGRGATHVVTTNQIELDAVAGSASLSSGDSFSFFGAYLLD